MVDVNSVRFTIVKVFGIEMLFTDCRVNRNSVPSCMHVYEVRHCDDDWGEPAEVSEWILVNHFGTLLSLTELSEWDGFSERTNKHFRYIDFEADGSPKEKDWSWADWESTDLAGYIESRSAA